MHDPAMAARFMSLRGALRSAFRTRAELALSAVLGSDGPLSATNVDHFWPRPVFRWRLSMDQHTRRDTLRFVLATLWSTTLRPFSDPIAWSRDGGIAVCYARESEVPCHRQTLLDSPWRLSGTPGAASLPAILVRINACRGRRRPQRANINESERSIQQTKECTK
jgi:hypothetical protein